MRIRKAPLPLCQLLEDPENPGLSSLHPDLMPASSCVQVWRGDAGITVETDTALPSWGPQCSGRTDQLPFTAQHGQDWDWGAQGTAGTQSKCLLAWEVGVSRRASWN